jgi:hypothetical protein
MAIDPGEGALIEGREDELRSLAAQLVLAADTGEVDAGHFLNDDGVTPLIIRRVDG